MNTRTAFYIAMAVSAARRILRKASPDSPGGNSQLIPWYTPGTPHDVLVNDAVVCEAASREVAESAVLTLSHMLSSAGIACRVTYMESDPEYVIGDYGRHGITRYVPSADPLLDDATREAVRNAVGMFQ